MLEFVKIATPILTIVSLVLIFLRLTKQQTKVISLTLGGTALLTAIFYGIYAFQSDFTFNNFAPFGMAIWLIVGVVNLIKTTSLGSLMDTKSVKY